MLRLTLYSKPECGLCDDLKTLLHNIQDDLPFVLEERNIEENQSDFERFRYLIPVLDIEEGILLYPPHREQMIRSSLQSVKNSSSTRSKQ